MIINNTPNVLCRGTDTLTHRQIFCQYSGTSSHSFGRSYTEYEDDDKEEDNEKIDEDEEGHEYEVGGNEEQDVEDDEEEEEEKMIKRKYWNNQ